MTYSAEVLADSPAGFWLLNETSGTTVTDSSGNAKHGTYTVPPTLANTTLATLTAPTFDHTQGHYVTLPVMSIGVDAPFTVEGVARLSDVTDPLTPRIVLGQEYDGTNLGIAIGARVAGSESTGVSGHINAGGYYGDWYVVPSGINWALNAVHHLAYTYDGTTGTIYVDGVAAGTHTPTGVATSTAGWRIGRSHASHYFPGAIAGVALYNSALSAVRIKAHYDALHGRAAVAFTGTGTFTAPAPDLLGPAPATVGFTGTGTLDVVVRPVGKRRRLVVVDINGEPYGELENATVGAITWTLNEPGESFAFTLPIGDPKAALLFDERFREVQVWRGDQLLAWGPAVRPSTDKANLAVVCRGVLWYLTRRAIGKANRTNHVTNGDFEDGLTGWNVGALAPQEAVASRSGIYWDADTVTDRVLTGSHSLKLTQLATGTPKYGVGASQFFVWDVDPAANPEGDLWTLVARCFIPSGSWRGPPVDGIGLRLSRYSTTETVSITPDGGGTAVLYPKPIETVTATIDADTPRDVWLRLEVAMLSPVTGTPEFVQVSVNAPDGSIYYDRVALSLNEGLRFYGVDQALIAKGIVEHLQDPAYGKSDLNLATDMPLTGVTRDRTYLHHEHPGGWDALDEFTTLDGGFDLSVALTPTTRTVRTHHPSKGVHRPKFALALGRNIADFAWTFDGENAANSVLALGTGDGSDREEAAATDPDAFTGGLLLETVFSAPPATPIDSLDELAREVLTTSTGPEILSVVCTAPTGTQPDPIGVLECGDTVPVTIRAGALTVDATYRIVELVLTPDDTVELVLNKRGGDL